MKRLYRSETDRMLFGVCGGLGEYFNVDATLIRFVFAGALIFGMGSPGILYLLLLLLMPNESQTDESAQMRLESGVNEISEHARRAVEKVKEHLDGAADDVATASGESVEPEPKRE